MMLLIEALVVVVVVSVVVWVVLVDQIEYRNDENFYMLTVWSFGVIIPRSEKLLSNLRKLRNAPEQTIFISAPMWFNQYVCNVGGTRSGK
jgi:hypothetical protein